MEYVRQEVNNLGALNAELEKIEVALGDKLGTESTGPRVMHADLDMNGNQILNLSTPAAPTDPVRLQDIPELVGQAQGANFVGETAPASPFSGMRWYKPSEATTFVYYVDGDSGQWVQEPVVSADSTLELQLAAAGSTKLVGGVEAGKIARKYSEFVSVTDFSHLAVGSDWTAAFQAAVNASLAVLVPAGINFEISTVNLREFSHVFGFTGASKVKVKSGGKGFRYAATPSVLGSTVTLAGVTFDFEVNSSCFSFYPSISAIQPRVVGCSFYSSISGAQRAVAIDIYGSAGGLITGNSFIGQAGGYDSMMDCIKIRGDAAHNCINIAVSLNEAKSVRRFVEIEGDQAAFQTNAGHRIVNNKAIGLSSYAVIARFSDYIPITDNLFDFIGAGISGGGPDYAAIFADTVPGLVVERNWIAPRYNAFGVFVTSQAATGLSKIEALKIKDNTMISNSYGGPSGVAIQIQGVPAMPIVGGNVSGNKVSNMSGGVHLIDNVTYVRVTDNDLNIPGYGAILKSGVSGYHAYENNVITVPNANTDAFVGKLNGDGTTVGRNWVNNQPTYVKTKIVANGNGSSKTFTTAHNMPGFIQWANVTAGSPDTVSSFVYYDATTIYCETLTAPPTGTSNVIFNIEASLYI